MKLIVMSAALFVAVNQPAEASMLDRLAEILAAPTCEQFVVTDMPKLADRILSPLPLLAPALYINDAKDLAQIMGASAKTHYLDSAGTYAADDISDDLRELSNVLVARGPGGQYRLSALSVGDRRANSAAMRVWLRRMRDARWYLNDNSFFTAFFRCR